MSRKVLLKTDSRALVVTGVKPTVAFKINKKMMSYQGVVSSCFTQVQYDCLQASDTREFKVWKRFLLRSCEPDSDMTSDFDGECSCDVRQLSSCQKFASILIHYMNPNKEHCSLSPPQPEGDTSIKWNYCGHVFNKGGSVDDMLAIQVFLICSKTVANKKRCFLWFCFNCTNICVYEQEKFVFQLKVLLMGNDLPSLSHWIF